MRKTAINKLQIGTGLDPDAKELVEKKAIELTTQDFEVIAEAEKAKLVQEDDIPMFYGTNNDAMSIDAALTRGYIMRSSKDDDSVKIGDLTLSIDAAIAAKLINEAAGGYIRANVEGRNTPAPFTRYDAIESPEALVKDEAKGKILDALAGFFASPTAENRRTAIEAIQQV